MKDIILFTSNCYGEDRSAALIAVELAGLLKEKGLTRRIMGASLASEGKDYIARGIELLYSSYVPPSGGFPTRSIKGFFKDLLHMRGLFNFVNEIKIKSERIELCVVVGDVALLYLSRSALKNCPIVFLAPAKSDYIEPHYAIEEWYIRKNADYILTHDDFTASCLSKKRIRALFLGNPMMDGLDYRKTLDLKEGRPVIGILPGSRDEAYDNLLMILELVELLSRDRDLTYLAAVPGTLDDGTILKKAAISGWSGITEGRDFFLIKENTRVMLCRDAFPEILIRSDVVIGLAGTANEQAAGMGKPIVGWSGSGPQTTPKRMKEQERLLGGALKVIRKFPFDAVSEIKLLLDDPGERKKRGELGRQHMGLPGGAGRIADFVFNEYLSTR